MTYQPLDDNNDGVVDANVDNQSVSTGSLVNNADGQAWETLKEVGFEKGDWLTLRESDINVGKSSTSSTSFVGYGDRTSTLLVNWDDLPSDATYGIRVLGQPDNASLEAAPMETDKYYNAVNVLTDAEFGATSGLFTIGPYHEFSSKPSGVKGYGLAIRSADGQTWSLWWGDIELAVKL